MTIKFILAIYCLLHRNVTNAGSCLLNAPIAPLNNYYNSFNLPGQFYTLDQQCKLLFGPLSSYSKCWVNLI